MKTAQASRTAKAIAASTLLLASDPRTAQAVAPGAAALCRQCLSASFTDRCLARSATYPVTRSVWRALERLTHPGIMAHYWRRKHWIEQRCRQAVAKGVTRVIVVGAGFDTLATRLSHEFSQVEWIEVDHPATQRVKQHALSQGEHAPARRVRFVALDLNRATLSEVLPQDDQPTLVILEGVLMYLPPAEVDRVLAALHALPAARLQVVFSFMTRWPDGSIGFRPQSALIMRWMAWSQEPFLWAMAPSSAQAFLRARGFECLELALANELATAVETSAPKLAGENVLRCERD